MTAAAAESTAIFSVVHAGPFVTFQDRGRPGNMRYGVASSGPMDRMAHAAANVAIGNQVDSTAIEVSPGGLRLRCEQGAATIGIAGGGFDGSWRVATVGPGDEVQVTAGPWGSWAYVTFSGQVDATRWLGHTATHTMAGLGGGPLQIGDSVVVHDAQPLPARDGEIPQPAADSPLATPTTEVRVVLGPQLRHFDDAAIRNFTEQTYTLSTAYDRMGVRLDGPALPPQGALSIPSEPILRGSVQVAGDGIPTVLLADHQTTGGYPKIATVVSSDIDRFAQNRSGDHVRFVPVSATEAVAATRKHADHLDRYLRATARPGRTLSQRLMLENLVHAATVTDDLLD